MNHQHMVQPVIQDDTAAVNRSPTAIAEEFVGMVTAPLKTPIIRALPRRRRRRSPPSTIRRSGRLALKDASRAPNATLQAQQVLSSKWELAVRNQPTREVIEALKTAFKGPIDSARREALRELLKFDLTGIECVFEEAC